MQSLTIAGESRPALQQTLQSWLAEMGGDGNGTELSRARTRLAKNPSGMVPRVMLIPPGLERLVPLLQNQSRAYLSCSA